MGEKSRRGSTNLALRIVQELDIGDQSALSENKFSIDINK